MEPFQSIAVETNLKIISSVLSDAPARWASDTKNRRTVLLIAWVTSIILLVVVTAAALLISHLLAGTAQWGVFLAAAVWAVFFGTVLLFFLPAKAIATVFGALLGIGADQVGTGNSIVSKAASSIRSLAEEIGLVTGTDAICVTQTLWLFFILLTLTCLPAFFPRSYNNLS